MKSCREYQEELPLLLMDALPADQAAPLRAHLEGCPTCQEEHQAIGETFGMLGPAEDLEPPVGLAGRTIARLDEERAKMAAPSWWRRLGQRLDAALGSFGAHRPTRVTGLATTAVVLALLVPVLSPNWERGRSVGTVSGCRLNLRLLGKALDRYAQAHQGVYPSNLSELNPRNLSVASPTALTPGRTPTAPDIEGWTATTTASPATDIITPMPVFPPTNRAWEGKAGGGETRGTAGFWAMPTAWVWLVFCLALGIFFASMITWREGRRFAARRLTPQEVRIVMQALAVWEKMPVQERGGDVQLLRQMLLEERLLAMEASTFERPEERGTFGYTDERGRILLNPNLCFANQRMCDSPRPDGCDVVATLCTLYHETRHLIGQAGESLAYEQEWLFVRRAVLWAVEERHTGLVEELSEWDREMPTRIRLYLGRDTLQEIQLRVEPALSQR